MANAKNLRRLTTEQAREIGKEGGKKSVEARRKRRLLSEIYGAFLSEKFKVKLEGREMETTGEEFLNQVIKKVLARGGAPAVSLMREIREATEGNKVELSGSIATPTLNLVLQGAPEVKP